MKAFSPVPGTVDALLTEQHTSDQPILLQCIGISRSTNGRCSIAVSDGGIFGKAYLLKSMFNMVDDGELRDGAYIELQSARVEIMPTSQKYPRLLIITGLRVIGQGSRYGNPRRWEPARGAAPLQPQQLTLPAQREGISQQEALPNASLRKRKAETPCSVERETSLTGASSRQGQEANQYNVEASQATPIKQRVAGPSRSANTLGPLTPEAVAERRLHSQPLVPISCLNPYRRSWALKARVVQKSELRPFRSASGQGNFFTADLLDADGSQIRAKAFNQAADRFFDKLELGAVVLVSAATIRPTDTRFNNLKHPFELILEENTAVEPCEDQIAFPLRLHQTRQLSDLEGLAVNTMVDVLAVVVNMSAIQHVTTRAGKETFKRSSIITDKSGCSIEFTLWGVHAKHVGEQLEQLTGRGEAPIIAVKAARLGEWLGSPILASTDSTIVFINPGNPEAVKLRDWYDNVGHELEPRALSKEIARASVPRLTIADVLSMKLEETESKDVQVEATITYIDPVTLFYPACSLRQEQVGRLCRKRVVQCEGDKWWCERCQANCEPEWRYGIRLHAADWTSHMEMKAFQEGGRAVMGGMEPVEARSMQKDDPEAFQMLMLGTHCKQMLLHLKLGKHTWRNREQIQAIVQRAEPMAFIRESQHLLTYMRRPLVESPHE